MCGLYFSTTNESAKLDTKFLTRGPDFYNEELSENMCMSHSLLSLTGDFTPQPIEETLSMLKNFEKKSENTLGSE